MTYTEHGDEIILQMKQEDYSILLSMLGRALHDPLADQDYEVFCLYIDFINRLNTGNPRWTPFGLPARPAGYELHA
jgi:hypothetical protein